MKEEVVKGKVVHKEGKYFLDVAGKLEEIPVGLFTDENVLKELSGEKEVEVYFTVSKPWVAGIASKVTALKIICNRPPQSLWGFVTHQSQEMINNVAKKLLIDGFITQEVYDKIQQSAG